MTTMEEVKETQQECCRYYKADFTPPGDELLVVISDGVYEGCIPIEGVCYPSPDHMSGWWLTTDEYNGDTDTLKTVHFHHIVEKRSEVAIYMALPFGYGFQLGGDEDCVWFDEGVAKEEA